MGQLAEAQSQRYFRIRAIHQHLGDLLDWVADLNASTLRLLSENDFGLVKTTILQRLSQNS